MVVNLNIEPDCFKIYVFYLHLKLGPFDQSAHFWKGFQNYLDLNPNPRFHSDLSWFVHRRTPKNMAL
jgi:hypothetical protein